MNAPVEAFASLEKYPFCNHAFLGRVDGLDVSVGRESAMERLRDVHVESRRQLGLGQMPFITAEQVHGNEVAVVEASANDAVVAGTDGLVTNVRNLCLGIYVADCCAIFLLDPVKRAIGLVHSGKKGTELGIAAAAIQKMQTHFGCVPGDIIAQLSPCIRPPFYEIDFANEIVRQCRACGVSQVFDCGKNTAADLSRYYSYRAEHGKTGRMLALMALM